MPDRLMKPGPGREITLAAPSACPICGEPVWSARLEAGLQYTDAWFDTHRWGSWEELGPAERWETVFFCVEFDRVVAGGCGHTVRGLQAVSWRAEMAATVHVEQTIEVARPRPVVDLDVLDGPLFEGPTRDLSRRGIRLEKPLAMRLGANAPVVPRFRGSAGMNQVASGMATVPIRRPLTPDGSPTATPISLDWTVEE